jgi:RND family efflux transporter MFP subunit
MNETPTDTQALERGRSRNIGCFLPVLILGCGVLTAWWLVASRPQPEQIAAPRLAPVVSTESLVPRTASLVVEGTGTVRPTAEITLSAEVSGRVVAVSSKLARSGAVEEGDTLLLIEQQSYLNAVAIARAEVQQREVDVALAAQNQAVAQQEYELLSARTGRTATSDTTLAARLARQQPQFAAAEASLARSEALLADAMLNLTRTAVTAPFSGRVRSESVDVGQVISPGQVLAEIYGTDAVEVDISLSTRQAALIDDLWDETGASRIPAKIQAEFGGTWYEWDGFVEHTSGALDPTTRTVEVVVRIPAPFDTEDDRPPLLIGSYARATIEGRSIEGFFAVPRRALREGPAVWVVSDKGVVSTATVGVIQEIQDTVFVQADLPSGTEIVVSDLTVMTEGMQVRSATRDEPSGASR